MIARRRIAFDARYINDRYHGIGRFAFQLLKHMVLMASEYDFIIYRSKFPDGRFKWNEITTSPNVSIRVGSRPIYWPHEQLLWPIFFKRDSIDLFHSPYFNIPLLTRTPVIMTVHDMIFERIPQYMPNAWLRPYYKFLMLSGLRKSAKIITVSKSTAVDLRTIYQFPEEKLAIIPEGVDDSFSPIEHSSRVNEIRDRYDLSAPYILSVGARRPHKNHERLVRAYLNLCDEFPHDLVIVGPEDPRFPDVIQKELDRTGLDSRVKQLNWIPESDLPILYAMAEIVVLPSILEGFGLPALEAMACGTPVIAADNSSFPEVVGEAGILVDPYEITQIEGGMRSLLINKEKRKQLALAGLERARKFSWETAAQKTLEIYQELLA
jgi:glycosyltransferase involved in cell wall biosynthesis